jgi:hypothetical protein
MPMSMVDVRKVAVAVPQRGMRVGMHMRAGSTPPKVMGMLVVRIVCMGVFVFEGFVVVHVFVLFGQVQADADPHQQGRQPKLGPG